MGIAMAVRARADCFGNRVGAILVLDDRIISTGYNGTPASMTFYAQPFKESQLLAVARAYQDATGHHLKHPDLDSAAEGAGR